MSVAGMTAVSCVLLTKVVSRLELFQTTTEPETKFEPFTVRVKPAPPAAVLEGEREASVGAGLLMVKVRAVDSPPPGDARVGVRAEEFQANHRGHRGRRGTSHGRKPVG